MSRTLTRSSSTSFYIETPTFSSQQTTMIVRNNSHDRATKRSSILWRAVLAAIAAAATIQPDSDPNPLIAMPREVLVSSSSKSCSGYNLYLEVVATPANLSAVKSWPRHSKRETQIMTTIFDAQVTKRKGY